MRHPRFLLLPLLLILATLLSGCDRDRYNEGYTKGFNDGYQKAANQFNVDELSGLRAEQVLCLASPNFKSVHYLLTLDCDRTWPAGLENVRASGWRLLYAAVIGGLLTAFLFHLFLWLGWPPLCTMTATFASNTALRLNTYRQKQQQAIDTELEQARQGALTDLQAETNNLHRDINTLKQQKTDLENAIAAGVNRTSDAVTTQPQQAQEAPDKPTKTDDQTKTDGIAKTAKEIAEALKNLKKL